jgi:hypothetical protein
VDDPDNADARADALYPSRDITDRGKIHLHAAMFTYVDALIGVTVHDDM